MRGQKVATRSERGERGVTLERGIDVARLVAERWRIAERRGQLERDLRGHVERVPKLHEARVSLPRCGDFRSAQKRDVELGGCLLHLGRRAGGKTSLRRREHARRNRERRSTLSDSKLGNLRANVRRERAVTSLGPVDGEIGARDGGLALGFAHACRRGAARLKPEIDGRPVARFVLRRSAHRRPHIGREARVHGHDDARAHASRLGQTHRFLGERDLRSRSGCARERLFEGQRDPLGRVGVRESRVKRHRARTSEPEHDDENTHLTRMPPN